MDLDPAIELRHDDFVDRHIGPGVADIDQMLATLEIETLDDLIDRVVPPAIRIDHELDLGPGLTERDALSALRAVAEQNRVVTSMIGMGYVGTTTPPVIARNVLENPAWYTSYTPYQAEISQGRLEATLNFQTAVANLCGLDLANASLLDEATAAAEAMTLARRASRSTSSRFIVHDDVLPQTLAVLRTRAEPLGIELVPLGIDDIVGVDEPVFGALLSNPSGTGRFDDLSPVVAHIHDLGGLVVAATDLAASVIMRPVGEMGVDIAIGSAQRFGVPMGCGGPHAGFMAVREELARHLPGRLVGVSQDATGAPGLRLALQTREQHIRREKATSNICTAQALLANMAGLYACWHGPSGLTRISRRIHTTAVALADRVRSAGHRLRHESFFDTIVLDGVDADLLIETALAADINLRRVDDTSIGITVDETTTQADIDRLSIALGLATGTPTAALASPIPDPLWRSSPVLPQAVFNRYHSETEMLRYLRRLADRDLALDRTMIPLGSCTMKLNATSEMVPITWPTFADIHPFAPADQQAGYTTMIDELCSALAEITGYDAVSVQPNAGSQGEFAGLLAIAAYHRARGEHDRTLCLIPASAHGTNAASAIMAGFEVVVVACDERGDVDREDLDAKLAAFGERVACIMVTYPSTHGVFERGIRELCERVHAVGGQVYVDGANLNALAGLAQPGAFGADVSHLNLHKTFCIPHGGGGPGVGPVAVRSHLAEFLPAHPLAGADDTDGRVGAVSAAPYGSASILPISWMYLKMMGSAGLRRATEVAICAANYVARRLSVAYPVLYTGPGGFVAHECIIDLRGLTATTGVTVEDVAKRLIDYGFHAPTVSFPVSGTLMIEPTESENVGELDRFCDAMLAIRAEIAQIESGELTVDDSPLRHAPHTTAAITGDWERAYPRQVGACPSGSTTDKYFPPVGRIDNAHGDRNLVCDCAPLEAYETVPPPRIVTPV